MNSQYRHNTGKTHDTVKSWRQEDDNLDLLPSLAQNWGEIQSKDLLHTQAVQPVWTGTAF